MIKIVEDSFSKKDWDQVADHPLQAWEWGEVRKRTGVEVLRLGEFENNKLNAVYQITIHKIPLRHLTEKYKVGYLPRSQWPSKDTLNFLFDYSKKNKIIFIKLEPYVFHTSEFINQNLNLIKSSHQLFPDWTMILDLKQPEEELLKNMKPKTRYNIKLAQKKGVKVKEMTTYEGFEIFSKLYFETTKRQHYFGHDYNYHKKVFERLKGKILHILIAFYKDTPLAAYELFNFKDTLYYPYGGTSLEHRNLMGANLLMWETIRFGKKLGVSKFDMWGSSSPSASENDPYAGFTRFKEGYGAKYVQLIGSYDLIVNPVMYRVYSVIYKVRNLYLNLTSFR